jgi:hypothetical protein
VKATQQGIGVLFPYRIALRIDAGKQRGQSPEEHVETRRKQDAAVALAAGKRCDRNK